MVLYGYASNKAVTAVTVALPTLAASFTGLRMYARLGVTKNAGWDDGAITVALLASIATSTTMIAQTSNGLGKHVKEVEKQELKTYLRDFWAMIIVYNISLTFTKLSILLQYLRIFPQKPFRITVLAVMGIVGCYATWRFFSAVFTCVPVNAFWNLSIKDKRCQNRNALSMASTTLNMLTDIIIAVLPLPVLNKLQLPRQQRYALMGVFALAGLVVVISILRFPSLHVLMTSKDITYETPMASIWSCIEINVGIICSCLPTLRCLFPNMLRSATYAISVPSSSHREHKLSGHNHHKAWGYSKMGGAAGGDGAHNYNKPSAYGAGGQGSFGGKFSSHVPLSKATNDTHPSSGAGGGGGGGGGTYKSTITGAKGRLGPGSLHHLPKSAISRPLRARDAARDRDRELLDALDEIEMSSNLPKPTGDHHHGGNRRASSSAMGKIVVQTEIQQVESARTIPGDDGVRNLARMDPRINGRGPDMV